MWRYSNFYQKNVNYTKVELKCQNLIKNIETLIIKIKLNNNRWLFIIGAYAAGNSRNDFSKDLSKIFDKLKLDRSNL